MGVPRGPRWQHIGLSRSSVNFKLCPHCESVNPQIDRPSIHTLSLARHARFTVSTPSIHGSKGSIHGWIHGSLRTGGTWAPAWMLDFGRHTPTSVCPASLRHFFSHTHFSPRLSSSPASSFRHVRGWIMSNASDHGQVCM